jgi:hypothetical protein
VWRHDVRDVRTCVTSGRAWRHDVRDVYILVLLLFTRGVCRRFRWNATVSGVGAKFVDCNREPSSTWNNEMWRHVSLYRRIDVPQKQFANLVSNLGRYFICGPSFLFYGTRLFYRIFWTLCCTFLDFMCANKIQKYDGHIHLQYIQHDRPYMKYLPESLLVPLHRNHP